MVGIQSWLLLILVSVSMALTACKKSDSKSQARRGHGRTELITTAKTAPQAQNMSEGGSVNAPKPVKNAEKSLPTLLKEYFKIDDDAQGRTTGDEKKKDLSENTALEQVDLREELIDETESSPLQLTLSTTEEGQAPADTERALPLTGKSESSCEILKKSLVEIGWVQDQVEVYENPQSRTGKKLKVTYYHIKDRSFSNPTLYLMGYANRQLSKDFLAGMKHQADIYNFDPVVMESRGSGCSSAMPSQDSLKDWQYYASRSIAYDAEAIRQKLLQNKKWRIWGHEYAGYIALRIVEVAPEGVLSVHISDFAPMKSFTDYMKTRVESQWRAWESFKEYFKGQTKVELKDSDLQKVRAFLDKQTCPQNQKICGSNLIDTLVYLLARGDGKSWQQASQVMTDLLNENSDAMKALNSRAVHLQNGKMLATAVRMIDMDRDLNQLACAEAMKSVSKRAQASPINSCRLESQLGRSEVEKLKPVLQHDPLDMEKIRNYMEKNDIGYHWLVAEHSLFNPLTATTEHYEQFENILGTNFKKQSKSLFIAWDKEILESLKDSKSSQDLN